MMRNIGAWAFDFLSSYPRKFNICGTHSFTVYASAKGGTLESGYAMGTIVEKWSGQGIYSSSL